MTLAVWAAFSAIGYVALKLRMRGLAQLRKVADRFGSRATAADAGATAPDDLLSQEVLRLEGQLNHALANYRGAEATLSDIAPPDRTHREPDTPDAGAPGTYLASDGGGTLAQAVARHLTPLAAATVLAAVLTLGIFVERTVRASFTPELAARTR